MGKFYYLYEQTNTVSSDNLKILNESVVNGRPKISFRTVLQEANVKNQNKRVYSEEICESIVNKLQPKVSNSSLLMEVDHPLFVSDNKDVLQRRATIVEINNCGAKVNKLYIKNNQILGEVTTLSSFKGPDVAGLINDGVNFGFSLRALGSVEQLTDGTLSVKQPMIPITYDLVSSPSYSNARILELLPESLNDFISPDQTLLYEDTDELRNFMETEKVQVTNHNDVAQFLDQVLSESYRDIITKKIMFKL
jgi:hypothetical protein